MFSVLRRCKTLKYADIGKVRVDSRRWTVVATNGSNESSLN